MQEIVKNTFEIVFKLYGNQAGTHGKMTVNQAATHMTVGVLVVRCSLLQLVIVVIMSQSQVYASENNSTQCLTRCTASYSFNEAESYSQMFPSYDAMVTSLPKSIISLTLTDSCKLEQLNQNGLSRFAELRILSLNLCDVSRNIQGSVFDSLSNLQELTLNFTPSQQEHVLIKVCPTTFESLPQLKSLRIFPHTKNVRTEYEYLQHIDVSKILSHLPELQHLTLSTYRLDRGSIMIHADAPIPNLHSVDFTNNDWKVMPCLLPLSNLRLLNLSNNKIRSLSIGQGCLPTNNVTINLQNNLLYELASKDFNEYNMKVLSLDISDNYILRIEKTAFDHFVETNTTIQEITIGRLLQKNVEYQADFFKTLFRELSKTTTKELNLIGHNVNLTADDFNYLRVTSLNKFAVTQGRISGMSQNALNELTNLEELEVSYCYIGFVNEHAFDDLRKLGTLILTGSHFYDSRSLENVLRTARKLPALNTLKLNGMGKWPNGNYAIFNNEKLKNLDISDSTVNELSVTVSGLESFVANHMMCMGYKLNCLKLIPGKHIEVMEIANCPPCVERLKIIAQFKGHVPFQILKHFNAADNGFNSLEEEPLRRIQMRSLITLNLSSNKITNLDEKTFANMSKLKTIDLTSNSLQKIEQDVFSSLVLLQDLYLSDNLINFIDPTNFKGLQNLKNIFLQRNKFDCNCQLRLFRDWIQNTHISIQLDNCSHPANLQSISIGNFQLPWMKCDGHTNVVIALASIGIVLLITPVLVLAHYRLDIKYWYYFKYKFRNKMASGNSVYDAMVCYNIDDLSWVKNRLMPELEEGQDCQLKLCIHHRDFCAGELIRENIVNSMNDSHSVIFVMTNKFLNSEWGQFELEMALMKLLKVKRQFIVMVMLEKIPKKQLKSKLKCFMRHVTYIEWPSGDGDGVRERDQFWKKLKLALLEQKQTVPVGSQTPLLT